MRSKSNTNEALILALDFGGTKNSAALSTVGARDWIDRRQVFSPPNADAAYDYATMVALGRELVKGKTPAALGVSFGGPVRASGGEVIRSHHVAGWEGVPLREKLAREFGVPVAVDNDANAAALGEARSGAGRGCASLLYITVSTGVGGGWILDGKIYRGAKELAGEIGHLAIEPQGPVCVCGRRGCVEILASGPSIVREARARLARHATRGGGAILLALVGNDPSRVTAKEVNQAALAGDELACEVMDAAAGALGRGIGCALVLMNPQRVVIGGGVSKAGDHYFETVRTATRANVMPELRDHIDIVPAALGDDAPLWGAVALGQELLND